MPPQKSRNAERRSREYLTQAEVERLMKAAECLGQHGHRDATMLGLPSRPARLRTAQSGGAVVTLPSSAPSVASTPASVTVRLVPPPKPDLNRPLFHARERSRPHLSVLSVLSVRLQFRESEKW